MKELQYRTFSLKTHKKNWRIKKPNVCQFELTFKCGLHCRHCYSDCYNKQEYIKGELSTGQVKFLLDKIYNAGVIWLCWTGGDPLTRPDFLEFYSYAKDKGFIITIFTNGCSMTEEIAGYLKKQPPFVIEITLNAVTKETYEEISRVKGSFEKAMDGIKLITQNKLPLKIKTQVIKDNLEELPKIKEFVENLGLSFRPSAFLHARLNGDLRPCSLRISPEEILNLDGNKQPLDNDCQLSLNTEPQKPITENRTPNSRLFPCAIGGGDGIHIDPYGNVIPCNCIRGPKINLFEKSIEEAQKSILNWVRSRRFITDSKCKNCSIRDLCYNCPGKALLETGSLEEPVEWFCELAKKTVKLANC
ncbi:MAG: radical SAM protein [Candidatus Omnitrophica bacterium]|nr:radical SAM protein [Candidatus Omnitrophota bacterium]